MNKVTIIDFNDSFTYNIAAEINNLGIIPRVVPLKHANSFFNDILEHSLNVKDRFVVVLGPGPGSPLEYDYLNPLIAKLLVRENVFFMGICLGHQIIWGIKGVGTIKSKIPVHGGRIPVVIPAWDIFPSSFWGQKVLVQRYNSLTLRPDDLKNFREKLEDLSTGDCMGLYTTRCITYQFHPESIGTSFRERFFTPITDFLYNV